MARSLRIALALAACAAASGCDFDAALKACATAELCVTDGPAPDLRFPRNGQGLGNASSTMTVPFSPVRPLLAWDFAGDTRWQFRLQLNKCGPGTALDQCPFPDAKSNSNPQAQIPSTSFNWDSDLSIGARYWWRARGCDQTQPYMPCAAWSAPRYFDVGRPEGTVNDFGGFGQTALAVAQKVPANANATETVYLFHGGASGPTRWKEITVGPPTGVSADYSVVVSGAGDLNGDGYTDFAVGYQPSSNGWSPPVDVYYGSNGTGPVSNTYSELGPFPDDFGSAVGRAGDLNGDGYSDLAVCRPLDKRVDVFFGSPNGVGGAPPFSTARLDMPNADLGKPACSFAALNDVNADGYDDLAVAGVSQLLIYPGNESAGTWSGRVEVLPPAGSNGFGASMAAGDFNGDGHGDLVVTDTSGKAYLYVGSPSWFGGGGLPAPIPFTVPAGVAVTAGDLNGDGKMDLAVGGGTTGSLQIFFGTASGAPRAGPVISDSTIPGFGISIAGVGELGDDGYDDLAVGSRGGVVILRGAAADGDVGALRYSIIPPAGSNQFGVGVGAAF